MEALNIYQKGDYSEILLEEISGLIVRIKNEPRILYNLLDEIYDKLTHAKELGLVTDTLSTQIEDFKQTIFLSDINKKIKSFDRAETIADFNISHLEQIYLKFFKDFDTQKIVQKRYQEFENISLEFKILFHLELYTKGNLHKHDFEYLQTLIEQALDKGILSDSLKKKLCNLG